MLRLFSFILLLSAVFAASQSGLRVLKAPVPSAGKIVGGVEIEIEDAPHQVSMVYSFSLRCGGSLISSNAIATAAHCTQGTTPSKMYIRAGSRYFNTGGQLTSAKTIYEHESYSGTTIDYDFAVVVLSSKITTDFAAAINLAPQGANIAGGVQSETSGWGAIHEGGNVSLFLRLVKIPIVDRDTCNKIYNGIGASITPRMICAGGLQTGGKDACQGDSGGPLVVDGTLVGITSWGNGCARPGYPGVWARVSAVRDWFDDKLSKN